MLVKNSVVLRYVALVGGELIGPIFNIAMGRKGYSNRFNLTSLDHPTRPTTAASNTTLFPNHFRP